MMTELDHEQHIDGVDSPNEIASLRHIDTVIQKMKTKIEAAAGSDPVTWIIVSDHGFQKIEK
jgi:predicted AlkP superfamily pyrophosphatase or phosphodiesterase